MNYSIATNFDTRLIDYIGEIDSDHRIKWVYGKLNKDELGGGRASMILPKINKNDLEDYIKLCHDKGMKFNYLYNPMCMDNRDVDMKQQNIILKYIDYLVEIGIDGMTINSPYMCRVLRERYPNLYLTIGAYAANYSIQQIKYWKDMGANEITLHPQVCRRFKLLESMLNYTKDKDISLRLIGNNICLKDCPYQNSHGTEQSHASKKGDKTIFFDLDLISCTFCKVKDAAKIISSEWIRPEDVKIYQQLCDKTGNQNLAIKLVERTKETDFLCRVAKAYLEESYEGNLLDILNWPNIKEVPNFDMPGFVKGLITGGYNINEAKKFKDVFSLPDTYVDNKKLDNFLNKFLEEETCALKSCGTCSSNDSSSCHYCSSWANKVVNYDENQRQQWLDLVGGFLKKFDNGKIKK